MIQSFAGYQENLNPNTSLIAQSLHNYIKVHYFKPSIIFRIL